MRCIAVAHLHQYLLLLPSPSLPVQVKRGKRYAWYGRLTHRQAAVAADLAAVWRRIRVQPHRRPQQVGGWVGGWVRGTGRG